MDPRTPVLVGGGQLNQRADPLEPVDMIVEAVRLAAADAGAPALAAAVDSVRVVGMLSWRYRDPGALVAERLGATPRHTLYTGAGGSHPQALVNDAAADVQAGRCDVVVVGGAEAWRTRMALKKQGLKPDWTRQGDDVPEPEIRRAVSMQHPTEIAAGADRPVHVYPLFEQALRLATGRSDTEHRAEVARLWARFSGVAATNPCAWVGEAVSAGDIATPSASNRVISWPYTKLMVSNNSVEQAAAVIVCSVEAAQRLGVPSDRWVFPLAGAEAADTDAIGERHRLDGSPAIRHAGATALALAGVEVGDLGPVDLYSCFPSAVQVAAHELGLPLDDPSRELTITGGLTFAGGPWNNYSTHAIAAMIDAVRSTGRVGLVTANSGYLTKHSMGVYGPDPIAQGFRRESAQAAVDAEDTTPLVEQHSGAASLETWTVRHDRDGRPDLAIATLRVVGGGRTLARSDDAATIGALMADTDAREAVVAEDASFILDS
ncbi:acetyl-CoA acetyltransferase [Aeromicrobium ginsengisoli]|uniref:Acetyl-CoA acetyltransferase n=1 Tax=Aeromicrobium ginsengisoli TaxID=363867 RepID=A0A5M4F901_9ACTN|nr:acetyl-CoA acetyltransferase [Aeromicrobium ginsengisoli]KAA1394247.1 acetyl-CoA acetyltransferase [Aeromicrobium ginsengisoli]